MKTYCSDSKNALKTDKGISFTLNKNKTRAKVLFKKRNF